MGLGKEESNFDGLTGVRYGSHTNESAALEKAECLHEVTKSQLTVSIFSIFGSRSVTFPLSSLYKEKA